MANNIFNQYTIIPNTLTKYTALRGVSDYSQIGMYEQYEKGYQFLSVLSLPKFMEKLGEKDDVIRAMNANIRQTMEMEFRGLDGLPDMTADTLEITDGINTQRMINRVTQETSVNISMQYFEKHGSLFTKYAEMYLRGLKDPMTQARTYHGLIASGDLAPSYENEVFTFLYYVTDSTMLRLERAVLLCNAQFANADMSMYNGSKDNITNNELTVDFTCFPIWGAEVDKAAKYLLEHEITGVSVTNNNGAIQYNGQGSAQMSTSRIDGATRLQASVLDSDGYKWGIMQEGNPSALADLVNANQNG
jgi:hypothetical protein